MCSHYWSVLEHYHHPQQTDKWTTALCPVPLTVPQPPQPSSSYPSSWVIWIYGFFFVVVRVRFWFLLNKSKASVSFVFCFSVLSDDWFTQISFIAGRWLNDSEHQGVVCLFVSTFSLSFPVLELLALHRGTCRIIIAKFHSLIRDSCWEQMGVVWLSAKYWYFLVYVTQIFIMLAFLFWWSIHNFFWILKVSWLWWFNILVIIKMNFFFCDNYS